MNRKKEVQTKMGPGIKTCKTMAALAAGLGILISPAAAFAGFTTNVFASQSLLFVESTNIYNQANSLGEAGWPTWEYPSPPGVRTLLRFDLPSTNQMQVSSAILHFVAINVNPPNDEPYAPNYVSDDSWTSATVWSNQPSFTPPSSGFVLTLNPLISHLITNGYYSAYSADVSEFFINNPATEGQGLPFSLMMQGMENNGGRVFQFYAMNGVNDINAANANVYLEVMFIPEPSSSSLLMMITVGMMLIGRRLSRSS